MYIPSYGLFGIFNVVDVAEYLHDFKRSMNHVVLNVMRCKGATMTINLTFIMLNPNKKPISLFVIVHFKSAVKM